MGTTLSSIFNRLHPWNHVHWCIFNNRNESQSLLVLSLHEAPMHGNAPRLACKTIHISGHRMGGNFHKRKKFGHISGLKHSHGSCSSRRIWACSEKQSNPRLPFLYKPKWSRIQCHLLVTRMPQKGALWNCNPYYKTYPCSSWWGLGTRIWRLFARFMDEDRAKWTINFCGGTKNQKGREKFGKRRVWISIQTIIN